MADADGRTLQRRRGDAVEDAALAFLQARGLRLLARNASARGGEIDLVMLDPDAPGGDALVFVEVRYRASDAFGGGAASVDARKRLRLVRAARVYLARHPRFASLPCRFDVVDAGGEPQNPTIDWIRDAFRADD